MAQPDANTGRRRGRRVSTSLSEINVIPLVDVMLVLLIIFMVAAPMMQKGVEVNLPVSRRADKLTNAQPLYVTVPVSYRKDQRVFIDDEGIPIDASGVLVDGTKMNGIVDLRDALVRYSGQFARNVTERLMTYAIGRGPEYHDMPMIRSIVRDAAARNYRFSSIVLGIVKSPQFQTNMKLTQDKVREIAVRD